MIASTVCKVESSIGGIRFSSSSLPSRLLDTTALVTPWGQAEHPAVLFMSAGAGGDLPQIPVIVGEVLEKTPRPVRIIVEGQGVRGVVMTYSLAVSSKEPYFMDLSGFCLSKS